MPEQQPREPLWRVMDDSYDQHTPFRCCYAAQIRAVAEAIEDRFADAAMISTDPIADVVNWLADEALRAEEAGE